VLDTDVFPVGESISATITQTRSGSPLNTWPFIIVVKDPNGKNCFENTGLAFAALDPIRHTLGATSNWIFEINMTPSTYFNIEPYSSEIFCGSVQIEIEKVINGVILTAPYISLDTIKMQVNVDFTTRVSTQTE